MSLGKIIMRMADFINMFDIFNFFTYSPTFFIKREPVYKSTIGSFIFLGYAIFSCYWIIQNFISFITSFNDIKVLNDSLTTTIVRTINNQDAYFGVGFKDLNGIPIMINDLPGIQIQVKSFNNYSISPITNYNLTACDAKFMISLKEWNNTDPIKRNNLQNYLNSSYLCPDSNFNVTLFPVDWMNSTGYFEILIRITKLSMVNSTMNLIKLRRPRIELIYSAYSLILNNFTTPLKTFIDSTHGFFLNTIVSTSEIKLSPLIIKDNDPLNSDLMNPFKSDSNQNQIDGAIFFIGQETIMNNDVFDRSISLLNDENLIFKRYRFRLSSQRREINRYRTNIFDFLANISAFTAFVLFILTIIMNHLNDILAKNYIFRVLFSLKSFENILKFKHNFLIKDEENLKKKIKINTGVNIRTFNISKNEAKMDEVKEFVEEKEENSCESKSKLEILTQNKKLNFSGERNIIEIETKNSNLVPEFIENIKNERINSILKLSSKIKQDHKGKFENSSKMKNSIIPKSRINELKENKSNQNFNLKSKKGEKSIVKIVEEKGYNFDFLLLEKAYLENDIYFCGSCNKNDRNIGEILYENADRKIAEFLDIETLFAKYRELDMIKNLLFDDKQIILFEIISKLANLSAVFSKNNDEIKDLLDFEDKKLEEEYFRNLSTIRKRGNEMDLKILENYQSLY